MNASRSCVGRGPVEPGDLVVLAVGVVVALLGAAHLVPAEQHRDAEGQQQGGEHRPGLAGPQGQHAGSSVGPSAPQFHERLSSVPSRLASPLASLCLAS